MSSTAPTPTPGVVNGHTRHSPYSYTPSAGANIAFLVIFVILILGHSALGLKYRTWFFSGMFILGGIGEAVGYIGRVGSAYDVTLNNYFIMQIVCLIISPAFFSAGLYVTIGNLAAIVGRANSFLKPMYYVIIFSTFDLIALVVQAIGGAGAAQGEQNGTSTVNSTHIMEAGIVIQLVGNIVFSTVALTLYFRTRKTSHLQGIPTPFPKTKGFKLFVAAIIISDIAIVVRGIYRVIELAQGWNGYLITTEPWFYGFDTALMIICMGVWVFGHPGLTLGRELARSNLLNRGKSEVTPQRSVDDLNTIKA